MNSEIARERISYVARPDSMTSSEGDFLATHVAVNRLKLLDKFEMAPNGGKSYGEEDIFKQYVMNSMKGNQLPNLYENFERLAELQHKALMMCNDYEIVRDKFKICLDYHVNSIEIRNSLYQSNMDLQSYKERLYNVIQPVYDSAKMSGFTEWIPRKQRWK